MKNVILAGNAITANILNSYLAGDQRYKVLAATVDDAFVGRDGVPGLETIPFSEVTETHAPKQCTVIMAMGYNDLNRSRESMFTRTKELGYEIETYVHPDARVYTEHPLGEGSIVLPGAVLEPHVQVGANTMVWCNATLAHDSAVEENCWIASGAVISGQAVVGRNVFVGVNATVVNRVTVREYCIIGGGALITRNTNPSSVHLARSGEEVRFSAEDYVKYCGV